MGRSAGTIGTGWQRAAGSAQDRRRWAGVPGPSGQVGNGPQDWRRTAAGGPECRDHRDRLATGRRAGAGPPQVGRSAGTIGTGCNGPQGWRRTAAGGPECRDHRDRLQRAAGSAQDRRRWAGVPGPSGQAGNGPQDRRRTAAGGPECRDHRDRLQRAAGSAQGRRRRAGEGARRSRAPSPAASTKSGRRRCDTLRKACRLIGR